MLAACAVVQGRCAQCSMALQPSRRGHAPPKLKPPPVAPPPNEKAGVELAAAPELAAGVAPNPNAGAEDAPPVAGAVW